MKPDYNLTLSDIAYKAEMNDFTLTEHEAINVWLLIPEGCEKFSKLKKEYDHLEGCDRAVLMLNIKNYNNYLIVKGLGEFNIKK